MRFSNIFSPNGELHRDFHSTPDLAQQVAIACGTGNGINKIHRSQEDLSLMGGSRTLPPPTHPPPPPPTVQVVKVEVSRGSQEYDSFSKERDEEGELPLNF